MVLLDINFLYALCFLRKDMTVLNNTKNEILLY